GKTKAYCLSDSSRDEGEIFRQRRHNGCLKKRSRAVRIDSHISIASEKHCYLFLSFNRSDRRRERTANVGEKCVWVLGEAETRSKGEIVAEQCGSIGQVAGANDGRSGGIGHGFIATGKLNDDALRVFSGQRRFADKGRPCHRIAGLRHPLAIVKKRLDRHGAGHVIRYRRLVAQGLVFVEGKSANIDQRRHARGQKQSRKRTEGWTQA